ncbi:MAG TPA: adenosylcobinamide-GDP ribazoletransferase [Clostridia bacterium]|nr:adenosylcobinamide-GDP ribazoletransferase [Clostridia bacterium]
MKRLILLIQFLTRIPINIRLDVTREDLSKAIIYFPIVGYIIGGILSLIYFTLNHSIDQLILVFLIVMIQVIITGGLHIDGLSDTFDGIFSGRKKIEILEIMKDPNVGTFGVLSIFFVLIFKFLLLYKIGNQILWVLLLMPVFSRFCLILAAYNGNYAREKGLGNLFIEQVSKKQLAIGLIFTIIPFYFIQSIYIGFIISMLFTLWFVRKVSKQIDGITGDTLGAIVELNEVLFLLVVYLLEVF